MVTGGLDKNAALGRGQSDRLLAQDVLARLQRANRPKNVLIVGERIVDGVHIQVRQECLVRAVPARNAQIMRNLARFLCLTQSNGDNFRMFSLLHRWDDLLHTDSRGA